MLVRHSVKVRWGVARTLFVFFGVMMLLACSAADARQAVAPKRILALYWSTKDFPSNFQFDQSFQAGLKSSPTWTEYYPEYWDTDRFPGEDQARVMRDYLRQKYAGRTIDVVVALGDRPLDFLLKYREDLFPTAPILFFSVKGPSPEQLAAGPGMTGFVGYNAYRQTLDLALRLHPGTKQVFIVSGSLAGVKEFEIACRRELGDYQSPAAINYLSDLPPEELTDKIKHLPRRSIILYIWQQAKDKQGRFLETEDVLSLVARSAPVPIYGLVSWEVGEGVVGGYVRTNEENGAKGAEVALRIANGAQARDIPVETFSIEPIFDWRELKRWGISEASLPPGSIVRFREPSFWDRYKWYASAVIFAFIVQSLLIIGLVINHSLLKRAEAERGRAQAEVADSEARLGGIVGSAMDAIISTDENQRIVLFNDAAEKMFRCAESEAIGQTLDRFIPDRFREEHNRHVRHFGESCVTKKNMGVSQAIYGRRMDGEEFPIESSISQLELHGQKFYTVILRDITRRKQAEEALRAATESLTIALEASRMGTWDLDLKRDFSGHRNLRHDQIFGYDTLQAEWGREIARRHILEQDREVFDAAFARAAVTGDLQFEARVRWPDGSIHWMAVRGRFYFDENGQPTRGAGVNYDITERKQAEETLRESEERFRSMADNAPVMVWMSGSDKKCTYCNRRWLEFTGRPLEEQLGDGWADSIHPDDYHRCLETYFSSFELRKPFTMEYRVRRHDGEYRWVFDTGAPRPSTNGKFPGYIGSCIDITERKAAEQALMNLSGQLIHAREDECARIARELHDGLNQRVALMSIELDQLRQNPPERPAELDQRVKEVIEQAVELSAAIQGMSHDLHPSKLVHLGLAAAVKSLCAELSKSYELKITFSAADVPVLSEEVSLCLYRVTQECLNNVIKHSGAKDAKVELRGFDEAILLRVSDSGRGFDVDTAQKKGRLGLVSMRERLRLVGGTITIHSQLSSGTQVKVSVPLSREAANAVGR